MTAEHVVLPDDEARHTPDGEDLWNESYYCDFVNADGSVGGWLRLGLYPNRQVAWWTTWIVRPGHPGVCSVDYRAPVPPGDGLVSETVHRPRRRRRPADRNRPASARSKRSASPPARPAHIIDPPEDVYVHGEQSGTPARLDLDLTWTTDGVPYHYDLTTRYEIPCLVTGTVTIDGETFTVDGQGQRDHSWGVRDWWAFGWCWCSMRLDDGTRVHLADIRMGIPGMPVFFGYIQTARRWPGAPRHRPHGDRGPGCARLPIQGRASRSPPHPARRRRHIGPRGDAGRLRTGPLAQRRTAGPAASPGPWCAAGPTTAVRAPAGSSGTNPTPSDALA